METNLLGHRSTAFPTSVGVARAIANEITADRRARRPWRFIAEKTSLTRVECIRLAHALDEVIDEIKTSRR